MGLVLKGNSEGISARRGNFDYTMMPVKITEQRKSQILGILALAALVLLIACLRYYLRLG